MTAFDIDTPAPLSTGIEVEVLTRYERRWTTGFEIASIDDGRIRLRRRSDGALLPMTFSAKEIRARR